MSKYTGYFIYAIPVVVEAESEEDALHELDDIPNPYFGDTIADYQGTLVEGREEGLILEMDGKAIRASYQ